MLYVIVIIGMFLGGCVSPHQRLANDYAQCEAIASNYNLGSARQQFMNQCVQIQPGYATVTPVYPGGSAYGQADAFGPMGYRGPTWEQFNGAVQNQANPRY